MTRPYAVILWDWNGTLLDDAEFGISIINGMLERRGLPVHGRHEHGQLFDFPVIRYYERVGFDFEKEPFEDLSHEFIDAYFANVRSCGLRPGSERLLESLQEAGYRQMILSASRQDYLEDLITHYGLGRYFEELLGIDTVHAPGKTGRALDWLRESGVDPAQVLLIGDTVHDAEVAEKMDIDCWLVPGGHHPRERLEATGRRCLEDIGCVGRELLQPAGKGLS
ncbi:MAG: HAD family hydrolase [Puniceicoccaceae bacterium]